MCSYLGLYPAKFLSPSMDGGRKRITTPRGRTAAPIRMVVAHSSLFKSSVLLRVGHKRYTVELVVVIFVAVLMVFFASGVVVVASGVFVVTNETPL